MPNPFLLNQRTGNSRQIWSAVIALMMLGWLATETNAAMITVTNAGFEDVSGQAPFNEFTFGTPNGWSLFGAVIGNPGVFTGTLEPNGVDFFNAPAPEGDKVALLFNSQSEGDGEYGYLQTLAATLQPFTRYELTVEVGNIASGTAENSVFFNLDEFPGYRIELLAGGMILAQDLNSLVIPEAEFRTSTVSFTTGAAHAQLGQNLGIRLVNLNVIPGGFTQATSPDLEVDFDDVQLSATAAVPEPSSLVLLGFGMLALGGIGWRRKRHHAQGTS